MLRVRKGKRSGTGDANKAIQRMWGCSCTSLYALIWDVHLKNARHEESIGPAPRPLERRPVPEGRKFRRWRQPERLSERPQGASCAEGSDRRNFQAGVMGRHFLPLATFHSFLEKKESRRPWNRIPKMGTVVNERHIRPLYVGPPRQLRGGKLPVRLCPACAAKKILQGWLILNLFIGRTRRKE